ncbi:pilin, partial [bacterium]|nr:pilin [bacterium]
AKDTLCIGALLHRRQIFDWKHHALVLISYVKNLRNRRSLLLPLRGFTLAEVLITLGIIGVVAALTIPTLMQNLNRRDTVAKVRSAYSTFSNAFALAEVHHGNASTWDGVTNQDVFSDASEYTQYGLTATDWVGFKYILDGIKTIKVCGHGQDTSCFPALVYNGTSYFVPFIFPNGTSAYIYRSPEGCSGGDKCGALTINTLKADMQSQSKLGRDQFEFYIFPGKILPKGYDDINSEHCNANIIGTPEAYACTAYIIREGNMDYLDE